MTLPKDPVRAAAYMDARRTKVPALARRSTVTANGCLEYDGHRDPAGYGRISAGLVHRVAYELLVGPIPSGLTLDHLCRNPACWNPTHLEPVSIGENVLRGDTVSARNKAKTECPAGHAYDEANTYLRADQRGRGCKKCRRAQYLAWQARQRDLVGSPA